jgi:hypothetical protein
MKGRAAVLAASAFGLLHSLPLIAAPAFAMHVFWQRRPSVSAADTARQTELTRGLGLLNLAADLAGLVEPTRAMALVKAVDFGALAVYFLRWDAVEALQPRPGCGKVYAVICAAASVALGAVAARAQF